MKKIHYLFILLAVISFTSCGSSAEEETTANTEDLTITETKFTDKTEGFKIAFPGKPIKSVQDIPVKGMGKVKLTDYSLTKDSYIYMVAISPQSMENIETDKDKISLLVSTKNGFCADMQLKVSEEKEIRVENKPGIFLKANSSQFYAALNILFVDSSLYQVTILTKKGQVPDTLVESFINSFELVK